MEKITYIEFYLAGDMIFSCRESWFPSPMDIELYKDILAGEHGVHRSLIKTDIRIVELPLPKSVSDELNKILGDNNISKSK